MTDRELLELAAKAVGGEIATGIWNGASLHIYTTNKSYTWNPLDREDDALWLVVKLGMGLDVLHGSGISMAYIHGKTQARESHGSDMWAATRRAIVHAAAALSTKETA
jgi:hypothetical protein